MLELSIPARFAFMFALLMLANKEYRKMDDINNKSWHEIIPAVLTMALACFLAGVILFESILEILYMPMG